MEFFITIKEKINTIENKWYTITDIVALLEIVGLYELVT